MKKLLSSLIISAAAVSALLIFEPGRSGFASPNSPLHTIQRNASPLTRLLLEQWLALKPPARDEFIASYIARNGIAFRPTAEILARLETMRYYRTLRALEAWRPEPTPTPKPTPRPTRTPPPDKPGKKPPTEPVPDSNTITILVANFRGPDPENYLVTDKIIQGLRAATSGYSDISIQPLGETITEQTGSKGGSAYARDLGTKRKAGIVLWGYYGVTREQANISVYFEVLRAPKSLFLRRNLETKNLSISDLNRFQIQTQLSNEMTYLVLLTVGLARYESGDYKGAIDRFTTALTPSDASSNVPEQIIGPDKIYFYRGSAYFDEARANGIDLSIADYDKAIKLNPDFVEAYNNRGNCYFRKSQYDLAIVDFSKAIELKPDYAVIYSNRGTAYYQKNQNDLAITDYGEAIKLNPDFAEVYYNRAVSYNQNGQDDLAIADYDKAIKLNPDFAEAYNDRGNTYIRKGQYDRAIIDCDRAIKLKPNYAKAYENRGYAYSEKGQYNLALADYDRAIKIAPDVAHTYNNRGAAYSERGQYDLSIADYDRAIKLKPDYAEAYSNRGAIYIRKGLYDLAIADSGKAIELKPDYAGAYYNRAVAYRNKGEFDRAIADLRSFLRITNDPNLRQNTEQLLRELGVK
jgi:tetratricopeptide (TPR) repeat protein